jgi:hypothetical protein
MPCWEVNVYTVEFKAANLELLKKALESLGYQYEILESRGQLIASISGGIELNLTKEQATVSDYNRNRLTRIRQEYAWKAIEEKAKQKKWFLKRKSKNKAQLRRY